MHPTAALAALVFCAATTALSVTATPERYYPVRSCKPSAPILVDVLAAERSKAAMRVTWAIEPTIDVVAVEMRHASGAQAAQVVRSYGALATGQRVTDQATFRVNVPTAAPIELQAVITFDPGDGAPLERAVTVVTLAEGELAITPDLPIVISGGVPSLEVPAVRIGGEGNR